MLDDDVDGVVGLSGVAGVEMLTSAIATEGALDGKAEEAFNVARELRASARRTRASAAADAASAAFARSSRSSISS